MEADGTPPLADGTAKYTERLLAALTRLLGDEVSARASMETALERARAGNALRGVSEEVLEEYLKRVCERAEGRLVEQSATTRRNASVAGPPRRVSVASAPSPGGHPRRPGWAPWGWGRLRRPQRS